MGQWGTHMELIEFEWDERTEISAFTYSNGTVTYRRQPLIVRPDPDQYWGQLIVWLKNQA